MRKFFIFLLFVILASCTAIASYHVTKGVLIRWTGFEDLRFIPNFAQRISQPQTSQPQLAQPDDASTAIETPRENRVQPDYGVEPSGDKQKFINTVFAKLGDFEKIEGQWKIQGKTVSAVSAQVVYRSDKHNMTLRLSNPSFEWHADNPDVMHNPIIEDLEVTASWPMIDPLFAEADSLWDISGALDIKGGRLVLVNALNQNVEIINTPFRPITLQVNDQKTGRILDNIVIAFYNLGVALMLENDVDSTKTIGENLLSFMIGQPVTIEKIEGDLTKGELIFENILLGEKSEPLLTFSQGKMTYNLDKSQLKRTKMHITNLSLFDPVIHVRFFPKEGEENALSQSIIPIVERLIGQGQDISALEDQLYVPITYEQVNIGEGFIELKQNDQAMRVQIESAQMNADVLDRIRQYTTSQSYGLLSAYLARLSETAFIVYMDKAQQARQNSNGLPQGLNNMPTNDSRLQVQPMEQAAEPSQNTEPSQTGGLQDLNLQF